MDLQNNQQGGTQAGQTPVPPQTNPPQPAAANPQGGQPLPGGQQPAQGMPPSFAQIPAQMPPQAQVPPQAQMPQGQPYPYNMPPQGYPAQPGMAQPGMMPGGVPPMYGDPMMAGMPYGAAGMPYGQGPAAPAVPEDTSPADFQLGAKLPPKLNVPIPQHNLSFDEPYFLRLIAGSISLSKEEKKRIIESIPKLKQSQIDELINIFEEERQKFAALSKKHVPQLEKLAQQHYLDWMDLETEYQQESKKNEDQGKAEEIRKQLGL